MLSLLSLIPQQARLSTPLLAPIKSSLLTQKSMLYPDAHCFHLYLLAMRNMLKKIKVLSFSIYFVLMLFPNIANMCISKEECLCMLNMHLSVH